VREQHRITIQPSRGITHLLRRRGFCQFAFALSAGQRLHDIFRAIAEAGVSISLIKKSEARISFVVALKDREATAAALRRLHLEPQLNAPCGVACVVASNMRYEPGVMYRILKALQAAGVEVLSTSDSFNSVSCLVREEQLEDALAALRKEFGVEVATAPQPLDPW